MLTDDEIMLRESLNLIDVSYHKILKINLNTGKYIPIKVYDSEIYENDDISEWVNHVADNGFIHEDNIAGFKLFADLKAVRILMKNNKHIKFKYRRKMNNSYKWVLMQLIRSVQYTNTNQVIMLYIRDIDDEYEAEYTENNNLKRISYTDAMTGLLNKNCYIDIVENNVYTANAAIFGDINGLKYINDNYGHEQGDKLISKFANILSNYFRKNSCYRISGDEFIVLCNNITKEEFIERFNKLYEEIQNMEIPIASIGYCYEKNGNIKTIVSNAEKNMYIDKKNFYKKFPQLKR